MIATQRIYRSLHIVLAIVLLGVLLFPFMVMISTMLRPGTEVYVRPPRWIPQQITLSNFARVWQDYNLIDAFRSSIFVSIGVTLCNLLLGIPAAYALARLRFAGRKFMMRLVLAIQLFSPVIVVITLFKIFAAIDLIDTHLGLVLADTVFTLSISVWIMTGYFTTIPVELEEAAWVDGCNRWRTIASIIVPLAMPGVVTAMIHTFIWTWNEFLFALSFIKSQPRMPLTLAIYRFVGRWSAQWELLTTASLLALIPVLVLFYLIERRLVAGLAAGAIKG